MPFVITVSTVDKLEYVDQHDGTAHEFDKNDSRLAIMGEPALWHVCEVIEDGGETLVSVGQRAAPIGSLTACKVAGRAVVAIGDIGGKSFCLRYSLAEFGEDAHELAVLARRAGLRFDVYAGPADQPRGHWAVDLETWATANATGIVRIREEETATQMQRALEAGNYNDSFVNPYNFIPFPEGLTDAQMRAQPPGHGSLAPGRLAGQIKVEFDVVTPLLLREEKTAVNWSFPRRENRLGERVPAVPGSSLKGAVRSLHEVLAGGCLRVFDPDALPTYRDDADVAARTGWTLARVEAVTPDGMPTSMTLCDEVVWVRATDLHGVLGGAANLITGATVDLTAPPGGWAERRGRFEHRGAPGLLAAGTSWVVLMTDAQARDRRHPYWVATGKLTTAIDVTIQQGAWQEFHACLSDGQDAVVARRPTQAGQAPPLATKPVTFGHLVGTRQVISSHLRSGDVLWVKQSAGLITGLSVSYLWRHVGVGAAVDRVPEVLKPCDDPERLCPSCRAFGMARTRQAEGATSESRQQAYRAHVRFGTAWPIGLATLELLDLPPMGTPHIGAGQFYLKYGRGNDRATRNHAIAASHWGSPQDGTPGARRQLRGRKMYWHGDPRAQWAAWQERYARHRARQWHNAQMRTNAEVVAAGSFAVTLYFENLSEADLGGLIASLAPALLFKEHDVPIGIGGHACIRTRLGGGKPLGLGTIESKIVDLRVHTAGERYLGDTAQPPKAPADYVDAFRSSVPEAVCRTWPDVAAMLDWNHVARAFIAYPPGSSWANAGERDFDNTYKFFQATSGKALADHADRAANRMRGPAPPRELDQFIPREAPE